MQLTKFLNLNLKLCYEQKTKFKLTIWINKYRQYALNVEKYASNILTNPKLMIKHWK